MSTVDQLVLFSNASGAEVGVWQNGRLYMLFVKNAIVTGTDLTNLVTFAKTMDGIA